MFPVPSLLSPVVLRFRSLLQTSVPLLFSSGVVPWGHVPAWARRRGIVATPSPLTLGRLTLGNTLWVFVTRGLAIRWLTAPMG